MITASVEPGQMNPRSIHVLYKTMVEQEYWSDWSKKYDVLIVAVRISLAASVRESLTVTSRVDR